MPKLIKGDHLTAGQRMEVKRKFVHRWTHENAEQNYFGKCPACAQSQSRPNKQWHALHAPIISDSEWLADHAFYVNKDGQLSSNRHYAEPAWMADQPTEQEKN